MVIVLTISLLVLQAPASSATSEPAPVAAQRALAEGHVARRSFGEAGEAYLELAAMPGVVRRDELDRAHLNLDSAYLTSKHTRYLCHALQVAELTLAEGGFDEDQEAKFWQDIRDDDLQRLQAAARATGQANCRFEPNGAPRRVAVALLADDAAPTSVLPTSERPPPRPDEAASVPGPRHRSRNERRQRVQTAAGATLVGVGLGSLGLLAGVLELHRRQARALGRMNEAAEAAGGFSMAGLQYHDQIYEDAVVTRGAAIGLGVAAAATLTTGIALLTTRKRATRTVALLPQGGFHGAGATLRLQF